MKAEDWEKQQNRSSRKIRQVLILPDMPALPYLRMEQKIIWYITLLKVPGRIERTRRPYSKIYLE